MGFVAQSHPSTSQPRLVTEPKGTKARYKTTNWAEYNAAHKARGSLTVWLNKDRPITVSVAPVA